MPTHKAGSHYPVVNAPAFQEAEKVQELIETQKKQEEEKFAQLMLSAAETAHEANRVLCASLAHYISEPWDVAPEWQKESCMAGVLAIFASPNLTPEQSHENWMRLKLESGWTFGPIKDAEAKTHPCLLAYSELPEEQKLKDELFGIVVRGVLGIPQIPRLSLAPPPQSNPIDEPSASGSVN